MIHHPPTSLTLSLLWLALTLFSIAVGAVNPPGSYGGAAITGGDSHTVALRSDGTVWAWGGGNSHGQLGNGTNNPNLTPVRVSGLSNIIALASGSNHTVALKSDGTVWTWGRNDWGQLGDGTTIDHNIPLLVNGLNDVVTLAAGIQHTLASKSDGTVWAWGDNRWGQLVDGTTNPRSAPAQVIGLNKVITLAHGAPWHSMALKDDGTVWTWGGGYLLPTPAPVSELSNIVALASGYSHTVALKGDGTVWTLGDNDEGQLGDGTTNPHYTPAPVSGLNNIVAIAAGGFHNIALKGDGTIWGWGRNSIGQLGDGTTDQRPIPVPLTSLRGCTKTLITQAGR